METKIALVGIVVENTDAVTQINDLLHRYGEYIIGRMGVPHRERGVSIISVAMDAPADVISALSGKLGNIPGVTSKTITSKVGTNG
ncbi:MAG: iron-only hydrogenase system regulator [Clostridia bacterium]|nr:iron-only hydrogenase system regulator [Clostridia bacterium]